MSDPIELATAAIGGGGSVGAFVLWLLRRGERATEKTEETAATKLDLVLDKVSKIELSMAQFSERHSNLVGEFSGLRERVNEVAKDHSGRIARLEEFATEQRTLRSKRR